MIYEENVPRWGARMYGGNTYYWESNAPKQGEVPIVETECAARFAPDPEGG